MATPEPIRDSSLERSLPSSPETEKAILGAVILDNTLIAQAIELLKATDFYVPSHRRIFTALHDSTAGIGCVPIVCYALHAIELEHKADIVLIVAR